MSTLWCERAWLGGGCARSGVLIVLDGERIACVSIDVPHPPVGAERLDGLTLPGLANAHSHAFQRALRGHTHNGGGGSFLTWRRQMYELAMKLDPDRYLALARAAFAEMALAGITLVGEFHYLHHGPGGTPYEDPNAMGRAVIEAAAEVGVRLTLLDTCYLHGGIGAAPDPAQRRFADAGVEAWTARVEALRPGPSLRHGAAVQSVRAVDPAAVRAVATWAATRELPLHAHVSEQPAENEACLEAHGCTPTELLADAGAVTQRFTAIHATHVSKRDIALLGEARAGCCVCPTTERDLADGIGPAARLRRAGARLTLGSDSHAVIDLFEEERAVELDERLATGVRGHHTSAELLGAASGSGYASLGWPEGGRIHRGALADFTTVSLDGVRLAGTPTRYTIPSVVFAATATDVRHVMVGGRWIVRDGAHVRLDVARELASALGR